MRDLAHHQVELQFAGTVPSAAFESLDGVAELAADGQHPQDARVRVDRAGRPGRRLVRRPRLRQPRAVAEETFLAQYSDAAKVA